MLLRYTSTLYSYRVGAIDPGAGAFEGYVLGIAKDGKALYVLRPPSKRVPSRALGARGHCRASWNGSQSRGLSLTIRSVCEGPPIVGILDRWVRTGLGSGALRDRSVRSPSVRPRPTDFGLSARL